MGMFKPKNHIQFELYNFIFIAYQVKNDPI